MIYEARLPNFALAHFIYQQVKVLRLLRLSTSLSQKLLPRYGCLFVNPPTQVTVSYRPCIRRPAKGFPRTGAENTRNKSAKVQSHETLWSPYLFGRELGSHLSIIPIPDWWAPNEAAPKTLHTAMSSPIDASTSSRDTGAGAEEKPRLTEVEKKQNHIASGMSCLVCFFCLAALVSSLCNT